MNISASFQRALFSWVALLTLVLALGACSQSRRGFVQPGEVEVWAPVELCSNESALLTKACFSATLHYTENYLEFQVLDIGIPANEVAQTPYRILARPEGAQSFQVLKTGVTAGLGARFTVSPRSDKGYWIEDYEEWIVELESSITPDGLAYEDAAPGQGERLTRGVLDYPELYLKQQNNIN